MEKKMTEWFPTHIKPVHVGVYQLVQGYAYFDGKNWGLTRTFIDHVNTLMSKWADQNKMWRGFTEQQP